MTNFRYANSRYMHIATRSWVMTAFFDRPHEALHFQMLLDPLEKQLDLPPRFPAHQSNATSSPNCFAWAEGEVEAVPKVVEGHGGGRARHPW